MRSGPRREEGAGGTGVPGGQCPGSVPGKGKGQRTVGGAGAEEEGEEGQGQGRTGL